MSDRNEESAKQAANQARESRMSDGFGAKRPAWALTPWV